MNRRLISTLFLVLSLFSTGVALAENRDITLFNLSVGNVERIEEKSTCGGFQDKDAYPWVRSDETRLLGTLQVPNWSSPRECSRTYCLETPDWRDSSSAGTSCFKFTVSSYSKQVCGAPVMGNANCDNHYYYTSTLTSAPSKGDAFAPISGQKNELQSKRYRVSLLSTGAIIVADVGPSYRKKPN
jgi:hypothetical protein